MAPWRAGGPGTYAAAGRCSPRASSSRSPSLRARPGRARRPGTDHVALPGCRRQPSTLPGTAARRPYAARCGSRSRETSTSKESSPTACGTRPRRWTPRPPPCARLTSRSSNLETSVGTGGRPEPGKRFTFSAGPAAFDALAAAGIDVASMANNHALDFGRARLPSTLRAVEDAAPALEVIGIGRDRASGLPPGAGRGRWHGRGDPRRLRRRPGPDRRPHRSWAATDDAPGVADALDPARLLATVRRTDRRPTSSWPTSTGECRASGAPAPTSGASRPGCAAGADVVVGSHAHVAPGRRPARAGLRRLRARQLRLVLPRHRGDRPHRGAHPHRETAPRAGRARTGRALVLVAGPDRRGRTAVTGPGKDAEAFAAERRSLRSCAGLAD